MPRLSRRDVGVVRTRSRDRVVAIGAPRSPTSWPLTRAAGAAASASNVNAASRSSDLDYERSREPPGRVRRPVQVPLWPGKVVQQPVAVRTRSGCHRLAPDPQSMPSADRLRRDVSRPASDRRVRGDLAAVGSVTITAAPTIRTRAVLDDTERQLEHLLHARATSSSSERRCSCLRWSCRCYFRRPPTIAVRRPAIRRTSAQRPRIAARAAGRRGDRTHSAGQDRHRSRLRIARFAGRIPAPDASGTPGCRRPARRWPAGTVRANARTGLVPRCGTVRDASTRVRGVNIERRHREGARRDV